VKYWHYILAKRKIGDIDEYSIREAYYNSKDEIVAITENPSVVIGESREEIINILDGMLKDVQSYDVVDLDNLKFGKLDD